MRMLCIVAAALLVAVATGPSRADDTPSPEGIAAAKELLSVLSPDMIKQFTASITGAFWPAVEQKARADNIDDATIGELRREFDRIQMAFLADVMNDAPAVYARHFTVAELHDLVAFYQTPTGNKALHEMPKVMSDMATLLVPRMPNVQHQISDAFTRVLQEHGYAK